MMRSVITSFLGLVAACADAEPQNGFSPHPPLGDPLTARDLEGLWSRDPNVCRFYAVLSRGGGYGWGSQPDEPFPGSIGMNRWELNGSALTLSYNGRSPMTVQVAREGDRSLRITDAGGQSHVITRCNPGSIVYEMFGRTGTETDAEVCSSWVASPERDRICGADKGARERNPAPQQETANQSGK